MPDPCSAIHVLATARLHALALPGKGAMVAAKEEATYSKVGKA